MTAPFGASNELGSSMMKRLFLLAAIVATLAMPALAQDMKPITLNDVPPHVIAAALAAANGVKFVKVQIEYEDGAAIYEFSGKLPNGKTYEVDVFHDGAIEEVEEEIDMAAVPRPCARRSIGFSPTSSPPRSKRAPAQISASGTSSTPRMRAERKSTSKSAATGSAF